MPYAKKPVPSVQAPVAGPPSPVTPVECVTPMRCTALPLYRSIALPLYRSTALSLNRSTA